MKILYIASERSRAQVATRALRSISPNVTVLWGPNFERAAFAILENPDLAALIVEVQSDSQGCFYLKQLHSLGLEAPLVMVLPEGAASPSESLKAGANDYVARGPAFSQELPTVVARAIGGGQAPGITTPQSPVGVSVDRRTSRDFSPAREPERRVGDREPSFNEREQRRATEQSAAAGRQAKLEMLLHQERATRTGLEQKLAEAAAALQNAEQRHLSAATAAAAQVAERNTQYETGIARAAATQKSLEEQLRQSRLSRAAAVADVERLTLRNAELSSRLTEATETSNTLERRLAHLEIALDAANERASREHAGAAGQAVGRQAELRAQLEQEIEKRRNVEEELARAKRAHENAENQRSSVMTAATALWAERQAQFDAELAKAADARNTLDREARELAATLDQAQESLRAQSTEVERLTQREVELTSQLAQAAATRSTLERQLTDAADALKKANEGASRNRLTAATKSAERELELDGLIRQERAARADVEQRLAQVEAALREAEQQHTSAVTSATAEVKRLTQREAALASQLAEAVAIRSTLERQLTDASTALKNAGEGASRDRLAAETSVAERQAQFEIDLSQMAASRDAFKRQSSDAETALAAARHDHAAAANEVKRLAQREADLTSQLAEAASMRSALEQRLTDATTALNDANEGARRDRLTAETKATERDVEFNRLLGDQRAARADVEQRLTQVEAALREAEQQHTSATAAATTEIKRLAEREADLISQLAEAASMRSTLERQLTDAATALNNANEGARRDRLAAETTAAEREAEFDRLLGDQRAARADVEQRLAQAEAASREAEQRHASAMAVAATEQAERQAQFEIELSQTAATRDEFKQRFSDAETALAAARDDHAAAVTEIGRLTQREAELTSQLAHVDASLREAQHHHAAAMAAAATERAERQAQFEIELSQTAAARDEFQRLFHDAETALAAARDDHAAAATEVGRLTQREADLISQLAEAASMRSTLERQLTDTATALKAAREGAADLEQRLTQEIARREALDGTVADMRSAAADAEQRFREEMASLAARGRDEVTRLENQFASEREQTREQSRLREIEYQTERDTLDRARLTTESEVRRLAAQLTEANRNLEDARRNFEQTLDCVSNEHADSQAKLLATVAERDARIKDAEKQLDESRLELRRQFLRAPMALWRCSRDGALTHANRALADLVGYRQPDELRSVDFVNTVFESTDDLSWLIERCLSTKTRQSVETAWKRRNGDRLIVRLSAVEFAPDVIEIAVEDVTSVRVLEDRLARAHRMEAVARLASEIAVTCGRLLGDVHEDGQQWLMAVSDDSALRKRGERLLGEVARAASYLERLAAHGDEQTSALKPVELNRVLRDLKPVLRHVAGDDVELELSKKSSALNVDMKADRVERLFVNLASYGRERMPAGGRLKIELATVVVDQKFIADHPNVRRGHHALITVTAMRRAVATAGTLHAGATEAVTNDVVSQNPGVDLGALQELLQECGGHLWLTVDPPGNMVVKIRLPLRVWDDQPHSTTSDTPTSRKGAMARLFGH